MDKDRLEIEEGTAAEQSAAVLFMKSLCFMNYSQKPLRPLA
jgi:hypothetical protein